MVTDAVQAKLDNLPSGPGVYLFKDRKGKSIYIGKAKSLKHRVRSYFRRKRPARPEDGKSCGEPFTDLDYNRDRQ